MPKYARGRGRVYRRGKKWWIQYYVDGRRVREAAKTPDGAAVRNSQEARTILNATLGQIAEGRYAGPAAERVTFDDLAEGLLTDYKANGHRSLADTERRIRKHLRPFFGGKRAHRITSVDVQDFISKRRSEGASNGEINRELAGLKRAFNLGIRTDKIFRKPYIPRLEERNARKGFFEPAQFYALLRSSPNTYGLC
jgi:hypothetical protein